ncbi:hypothetical protein [Halovenus sp. HT40]|uniref:hypothetical protein n=1 Tax=Halovenus sp. HT40 TaxID=3126691 RepID=UPI00300E99E5
MVRIDYLNILDQFSDENPNEARRAKETNESHEQTKNETLNRLSDAPPAHCNNRIVGQKRNEASKAKRSAVSFN